MCTNELSSTESEEFQKYERSLRYALETLNDEIHFVLHYVSSKFFSKCSLSALKFKLAAYTDAVSQNQLTVTVNDLFKVEAKPENFEALKFIHQSRRHLWPPFKSTHTTYSISKQSEKDVMLSISSEILVPLCREVILEKRYRDVLKGQVSVLTFGEIGMGSVHTWHGTPDVRVRGAEVVYRKETEEKYEVNEVLSDDESGDGATTTREEKVMARDANLHQAIGTCIVSSFIEKSLHPDQQALVPTILIDETQFRVCLYDSEKDVLLISESKCLATKGGLSRSGMALLWVVTNHR